MENKMAFILVVRNWEALMATKGQVVTADMRSNFIDVAFSTVLTEAEQEELYSSIAK